MQLNKQKGNAVGSLIVLVLLIAGVVGWVKNIVALCHAPAIAAWAAMEVIRVIGIFIPIIGAVMGYV